ncbi:hypothetical protein W911_08580 [Hyphomicrobium nitrativorans NL23]|uniref:Proteinase inhibitor I42 chagasin domain-containing protein n=2 Tax=Hyphomicrobium TaxID=81 RepID=V5SJ53_9HYPH|nr:hypothetical protein W911_08580 [Hyphomicrobium nitrativorans NL23]
MAAVLMTFAFVAHAANDENPQVSVGATTTLELDGNPSTGYRWVLDVAASENTEIVTVEDAGYAKPATEPGKRPVLGAPSKQRFQVTGVASGEAMLVFYYVRSGDEAPSKTQEFLVEVIGGNE